MSSRRARRLAASLVLGLLGCGSPDPEITTATVHLRLAPDPSCVPPDGPVLVELRALGDFPTTDETVEILYARSAAAQIDRFPRETRLLSVVGRSGDDWVAGGLFPLDGASWDAAVLLLPFGRPCSLGRDIGAAPVGSAVTGLPDGGLLVAGGLDDGGEWALRRVVRISRAGLRLDSLTDDLQSNRVGATATVAGNHVLIAGGGEGTLGGAHDTWEVLDLGRGTFERTRPLCASGACRRRDHGAAALADGRVLLVGGRAIAGGPPLATAVLIDPVAGTVDDSVAAMPLGRVSSQVVVLDDGSVIVVGGTAADGSAPPPLRFDIGSRRFEALGVTLRDRSAVVAAALPGARLALVGEGSSIVEMVLLDGARPEVVELDLGVVLAPVAVATLPDATLLVEGTDAAGLPRAVVLDPGRGTVRATQSPTTPGMLLSLFDGAVAELSTSTVSFRREGLRTAFDSPPATLTGLDADWIALDAPGHWDDRGADLAATVDGAALWLPTLRFARLHAAVDLLGAGELELRAGTGATIVVSVDATGAEIEGCRVVRTDGQVVNVERDGTTLRLSVEGESGDCTVDDLPGRVDLGLRLRTGAVFRRLQISR